MKLIVIPKDLNHLDKYSKDVDGFILGVKDLCINFDSEYSVSEISNIIDKYPDKEIFVSINKNIFNAELSLLENTLKELDKLKISGVLFYDLSVVYLKNKNNLNIELVWNQNHMVTNYKTCNYYKSLNVNTAFIGEEITIEEINEIKDKTDMKIMVFGYGYPLMADSRRKLLSNYFISDNKEVPSNNIRVHDKDNSFIIREDKHGTTFFNEIICNGSCLITDTKIDYIVYSDQFIDDELSYKLVPLINKSINDKEYISDIDKLIGTDTNFFYKKTIYMVKKND